MTRLSFDITRRGAATATNATWNKALRAAGQDMGIFWHIQYRPKRFAQVAYSEYGAKLRSRPYEKKKYADKGHFRPLDYSGEARRDAAQQVVRSVIRRKGGLSVWVRGPRKLNFRPKTKRGRKPVDMRKEFKAWSARERVKLQKVMRQRTLYHLQRLGSKQRVTVRLRAA